MTIPTGTTAPPPIRATGPRPGMSDVTAPPVPTRGKPLRKPTHAEASSKLTSGLFGLIFGALVGGALLYFGFKIVGSAVLLLFCGIGLAMIFSRNAEVSDCPFCGTALTQLRQPDANGAPRPVQCRKCWEYSGLQKGFVSPYNPNAVEDEPTFRSPLAQDVVWPHGCVQCGAEPARFDEVSTFSVSKGLLVVGALRVSTFKLRGVPYCNVHKDAVAMKTEVGNKLFLDWRSLGMMRRYLAANRGRFVE